ncbi:MAG: indolepyruvate oxidoreductase subunit beta [Chlorobi bacterium]|nr:indolepyruvate oxidoreductase subunit beta [Chlorobiota bacterium]
MHDNPKNGDFRLRILLAGTGGQGVITAARLLSEYFVRKGDQVLSAQLHGMAQRGGAVQSTVCVNSGISPALPRGGADVVLGCEPVEAARTLPYVSADTVVFINTAPIVPFVLSQNYVLESGSSEYPDLGMLEESLRAATSRVYPLDATKMAQEAGSLKTINVVMLGCLFGAGVVPYPSQDFIDTIMVLAPPNLAETNTAAFRMGVEFAESLNVVEQAS